MILEEGSDDFIKELLVVGVGKSLEEAGDVLSDGDLEPPFFISEAPLHQWHQVLDSILLAHHLIQLHDLLHDADPNKLVFILEHGSHNRHT